MGVIVTCPEEEAGALAMTRPYATSAPPQSPAGQHDLSPSGMLEGLLADPRARLGVGIAALLATAGAVRHDPVGPRGTRAFQAVHRPPHAPSRPAAGVRQSRPLGPGPPA